MLGLGQPVQHPWVDQAGQLSFPSLQQWSPRSRLASVVQEALGSLSGQSSQLASPSSRPSESRLYHSASTATAST